MRKVIKKRGKTVKAYPLSDTNSMVQELIGKGLIQKREDGIYEIFSLEARDGKGELAKEGDYIKLSSSGEPYPNDAQFFKENHRHLDGDEYEQLPKWLDAWKAEDGMCQEIAFLIEEKGLVLNEQEPEKYFSAFLWGAPLSASREDVLIFYDIKKDAEGKILDADFNFVKREEFEEHYEE